MMRISKRFIATLCVGFLLAACSPKSPESLSQEAETLKEKGDLAAELITLKSAVEAFPENAQLRLLLADSNFRTGNGTQAITEYQNAFELDNSTLTPEIMQRILRIMYVQEMSEETFEFLAEINRPQILPEYQHFYKAAAYHRLGQVDEALALFDQIVGNDSALGALSSAYSEILIGGPQRAISFLEEALFKQQDLIEARFLLADVFYVQGQYREAASVFESTLVYPIKSIYARYRLAKIYLILDQEAQAQVMIDGLETTFPDIPEIQELKAELEFNRKNYATAKQFADLAASRDYRSDDLFFIMGVSNYYLQTYEQALRPLRAIQASSKRYEAAQNFIVVLELLTEGPKINLLDTNIARQQINASYELVRLGHIRPAQQMLQLISSEQANIDIKAYLHILAYALDPTDENYETLRDASMQSATTVVTKVMFVETALASNRDNDEVIASVLKAFKDSKQVELVTLTNRMLQGQKKRDAALNLIEQALEIDQTSAPLLSEYVSLMIQSGDLEKAEEIVLDNKDVAAFEPRAKAFAAELVNKGLDSQALKTFIGNAYEQGNSSLSTAIYYASIQADQPQAVIDILAPLSKRDNLNEAYYFLLYRAYLRTGQIEPTLALTQDWVRNSPSFVAYQYRLTSLDLARDYEMVLRELNRMERLFGANEYTKLMRVNYFLALNKADDAKKYWNLLPASMTQSLPGKEVEARILTLEGKFDEAIALLNEVDNQDSLSERGFGTLLGALRASGDVEAILTALNKRVEAQPFNQKLRIVFIDALSQLDDPRAIEQLEVLAEQMPDSIVVKNNLAWAYYLNQQNEQAVSVANELIAMELTQAEVLHTVGLILAEHGEKSLGVSALKRASELSDNEQFTQDYQKFLN
jgi:predicted Zn-dependent protease